MGTALLRWTIFLAVVIALPAWWITRPQPLADTALDGLVAEVARGETVTLLGRNGMGKTTTVRAITGMHPPRAGQIRFGEADITHLKSYKIAQRGIGLVPEGRQIFPNLTAEENLIATAANRRHGGEAWTLERIYTLFPRLSERRGHMGNELSGGEQQMLAVGRALMTNPQLLILDEATEGLAPLIREEIWACLRQIRREGLSVLVIDKNIDALMKLADRHYIVEKGEIVWAGTSAALADAPELKDRYLSI